MSNTYPITPTGRFAQDTSNTSQYAPKNKGIPFQSPITSPQLNGEFNLLENALRALQVSGQFYDNLQVYNQNSICKIVVAEGGSIKLRYYQCLKDNTTGKPPLTGITPNTTNDIDIYSLNGSEVINDTYWRQIGISTSNSLGSNVSSLSGAMVLLCDFSVCRAPCGTLKVKVLGNSQCDSAGIMGVFHLHFSGLAGCSFKIDAWYPAENTMTTVTYPWGYISLPGFALMQTPDGLYLAIHSSSVQTLDVSYNDLNFVPPLTSEIMASPSSQNKPYAIRPNGGTHIADIGVIKDSALSSQDSSGVSTTLRTNFLNGHIRVRGAFRMDTYIYHQLSAISMGNIGDCTDCVKINAGTLGINVGGLVEEQLPNIYNEGSVISENSGKGCINLVGSYNTQRDYAITPANSPFWIASVTPLNNDVTSATSYYEAGSESIGGTLNVPKLGFDASRNNPAYVNGGRVLSNSLVVQFVLQGF